MSYPVSAAFEAALSRSHRVGFHATVYGPGGAELISDLPITGGSVTVDRTAAVRRTCSVTLALNEETLPYMPTAQRRTPLDPYGNQLKLWRGIIFPDGTTELCPLGIFRITGTSMVDKSDGRSMTVNGVDRAQMVADAKFLLPYTIARGANVYTAIAALVNDRLPDNPTVTGDTTAYTTPQVVIDEQADPWAAAFELAVAIGAEAYFDVDGDLVLKDEPDPSAAAVDWEYVEGDTCTMTGLDRAYDAAEVYNGLTVTGENSQGDTPVTGFAYDDDPQSPTYWFGDFGQRPTTITSPLVLSSGQALAMAKAKIKRMVGLSEAVAVTIVPNPALDASDVIHVERAITGFNDDMLVQSFSVPLDTSTEMTLTCRAKRIPPA